MIYRTEYMNLLKDWQNKDIIKVVTGIRRCGKSTLLSILSNLEKQTSGEIKLKDENLKIGYMLQGDSLFPWRTILENCLIGLEITKTLNEETRNRVIKLLNKYGLKDFIDKYPSSLSGGMKQRVVCIELGHRYCLYKKRMK